MIGRLVRLVDQDETKVANRGKQSTAWANNKLWLLGLKSALPELMTYSFGLLGVKQGDMLEIMAEICDELRSKSDFWYEQNN